MTLIINTERPSDPTVAGVVCDRCKSEVRGEIELQEVIHLRLHAGYGSEWGDGNVVECDLCDACGHVLLRPFAKVLPSIELYRGQVATSLNPRRLACAEGNSPNVIRDGVADFVMDDRSRGQRLWLRICFELHRCALPAKVLFSPLWRSLVRFYTIVETEEHVLRLTYGITKGD